MAKSEKTTESPPARKRNAMSIGEIKKRKEEKRKITLVRKANDLVEARYRFSIWEVRVFTKLLTLIRPDDTEFVEQKINILEIIKDFGLQSNKSNYKWIKEGARGLMSKIIDMVITADDGKPEELMIPLLTKFKGRNDPVDGSYIKLSFAAEMKPFLLELKQRYLQYEFSNVANLRSPYYVRMYELLKQYEKIGQRRFSLSELRGMLGIREEYQQYGIFKRKIIEAARENINKFTDIQFEYEELKQGKSVAALLFHIRPNAAGSRAPAKPEITLSKAPARSASPGQQAFFNDFEEAVAEEIKQPLTDFAERLSEWWGVQHEEFFRRAEGKDAAEVEQAIAFTKERIRSGKAQNPAGVFLDALARGLQTPEQIKTRKEAEKKRLAAARQARLKTLSEKYNALIVNYSAAVNDAVRVIAAADPAITETIVADIKNTHRMLGDRKIDAYGLDDFRKNPMLRGMVIAAFMSKFPERFEPISQKFSPEVEAVKLEIRSVEPAFVFG